MVRIATPTSYHDYCYTDKTPFVDTVLQFIDKNVNHYDPDVLHGLASPIHTTLSEFTLNIF